MRDKLVQSFKDDDKVGQLPDPVLMRDEWLRIVQPVARQNRLDVIKPFKAVTLKERSTAAAQNYWLSRRTFGMPTNYDNIDWSK